MLHIFQFIGGVALLGGGAGLVGTWSLKSLSRHGNSTIRCRVDPGGDGDEHPEFFVNVLAAFRGETDFALANVSGSNLANFCIGFGICAYLTSLTIRRMQFGSDFTLNWIAALTVLVLMYVNNQHALPLTAIVPLAAFLLYYIKSLKGRVPEEDNETLSTSLPFAAAQFLGGVIGLYAGGELLLNAATHFALALGIPNDVVGLTIVALGTSVPDISASVIACRKKEMGIAIGNLVGSNISNLVVILTATLLACLRSLPTNPGIRADYMAVTVCSLICWFVVIRFEKIPRWTAVVLMVGYVGYIVARGIAVGDRDSLDDLLRRHPKKGLVDLFSRWALAQWHLLWCSISRNALASGSRVLGKPGANARRLMRRSSIP